MFIIFASHNNFIILGFLNYMDNNMFKVCNSPNNKKQVHLLRYIFRQQRVHVLWLSSQQTDVNLLLIICQQCNVAKIRNERAVAVQPKTTFARSLAVQATINCSSSVRYCDNNVFMSHHVHVKSTT